MRITFNSALLCVASVVAALIFSGCAAPARVEQMGTSGNPEQRVMHTPFRNNLAIKDVTGGRETNPMWVSNVSSGDFEKALESSLQATGLFAPRQAGRFLLTADLEKLEQPFVGLDMTVTANVRYIVVERKTGKEVFSKVVSIPYTAKFGDALIGTERLRLANEGAIRSNIEGLINELFLMDIHSISMN